MNRKDVKEMLHTSYTGTEKLPKAAAEKTQENISISVPKNWFVLLVIGILIIAAILTYQFVAVPALNNIRIENEAEKAVNSFVDMRIKNMGMNDAQWSLTKISANNVRQKFRDTPPDDAIYFRVAGEGKYAPPKIDIDLYVYSRDGKWTIGDR